MLLHSNKAGGTGGPGGRSGHKWPACHYWLDVRIFERFHILLITRDYASLV
jgi:hypothetical protein